MKCFDSNRRGKKRSKNNQYEHEAGGTEQMNDMKIREALECEAEKLLVSSWNVKNMQQSVHKKIQEGNRMKHYSIKKIIITAVVVCTLGSITAVAAGRIAGVSGHSSWKEAFYDYDQVDKMEQKLGYAVKAPETFSNGFVFSSGMPVHEEARDESGNMIKRSEGLSLIYKKGGMADLTLDIQEAGFMGDRETSDKVFNHNGIVLKYNEDNYRFVPADYEISAEEQAAVDAGKLYISYGSDKVENNVVQSISWEDEGTAYTMLAFDSTLSPEDYGEMAGEVIDAQ